MRAAEVKQILQDKGVKHLHHANTVVTSITYLTHGGLMSRQFVEEQGYPQTPQQSDELDKTVDVYNDIFLDPMDWHKYSRKINHYGPVLFVYSLDVLDDVPEHDVLVTRINVQNWPMEKELEEFRYFDTAAELRKSFSLGDYGHSVTIRHISRPLSFAHLEKVILDYPGPTHDGYFTAARARLEALLSQAAPHCSLEIRECAADCRCRADFYEKYKPGYTYHRFKTSL